MTLSEVIPARWRPQGRQSRPASLDAPDRAESKSSIPALECRSLSKTYGPVAAVNDFTLTVPRGGIAVLVGPSGCGKTTALRLIAGFETPNSGSITIGGRPVAISGRQTPPEKRRVGMVFQEGALFPHATVEQNVGYGLPRSDRREERIGEVLRLVGLANFRVRMPHELSGGEQQRVALARALAPSPDLLLLDEPFSSLDPGLRQQVRSDVQRILKDNGVTAIFVTHDQDEALLLGDTVVVMRDGNIEQAAAPEVIFHEPANRFVAEFMGTVDFLPARPGEDGLVTDIGTIPFGPIPPQTDNIEVMVRPDCIDCWPSDDGQGVITSREFRGAFYIYRIALPSGNSVRCLLSHTCEYPVGARMEVRLRDGHSMRPFAGGQAVVPPGGPDHCHS
jgi:iron(III) transport system ATP-binding protein